MLEIRKSTGRRRMRLWIFIGAIVFSFNSAAAGRDNSNTYWRGGDSSSGSYLNTRNSYSQSGSRKDFSQSVDDTASTEESIASTSECSARDLRSCDVSKSEVCIFSSGAYRCQCPSGYGRLSDGRCVLKNECEDSSINDCHKHAQCSDLSDGYTCQCKKGYYDISSDRANKPGRICKKKQNECSNKRKYGVDCDTNALCVDTDESFTCRCFPSFVDISVDYNALPGRKCAEDVNECANSALNGCSENAQCEDANEGYTCTCLDGYIDASPNSTFYPGRLCHKPEQSLTSACSSSNDCDANAICSDLYDSYKCQCKPGYTDISDDPYNSPGRKCKKLENECAISSRNNCSPYASCTDTRQSYFCACRSGYLDVSSQYNGNPGTHCIDTSNECLDLKFNSCDNNAECVDLTDGYACQCLPGFYDVSSSANLDPGRVCTVLTSCPSQPTDLMFLVDGSGSIGSDTFSGEVLRFVQQFVDLFDIGSTKTQVAMIQYSSGDLIEHEIDFKDYNNKAALLQAISQVKYNSGMTNTGRAITHMYQEGFSLKRGARVQSSSVERIAIVITDGRSQDKVRTAANEARAKGIKLFAIGVTDHVYDRELEEIAGSSKRVFKVRQFTELDVRLRSIIQKEACPDSGVTPALTDKCNVITHQGCNRGYNEICVKKNRKYQCVCPDGFLRNQVTGICGGSQCNPLLPTSCPWPAECKKTPYGNYRCACPSGYFRHKQTGFCVVEDTSLTLCFPDDPNSCPVNEVCAKLEGGKTRCVCKGVFERNERTGKCMIPGSCDPTVPNPCDIRKKEECLEHSSRRYYTCQCPANYRRHSQTKICLIDECATGQNDCHYAAECTDTDDSYICQCPYDDYIDMSEDLTKPGRICTKKVNECELGTHNCSINANCIDRDVGFLCQCKSDYVDFSPNPRQFAGVICKELVDECALGQDNCHENADCLDTLESYICVCKAGFIDLNFLRNPGRNCVQNECNAGSHDCSSHAQCIDTEGSYTCRCLDGYFDKDTSNPGRDCVQIVNECRFTSTHDCSPNAECSDLIDGYTCKCKSGFIDKSPSKNKYPGRICRSNQCSSDKYNDCSSNANCLDVGDIYVCTCKSGYTDYSVDISRPGRICLLNECTSGSHDCHANANCIDQRSGYTCQCKSGYHDLNQNNPGRSCSKVTNECAISTENDCHTYASCIDLLVGYTCECNNGFKDTGSRSNPGRSCESNFCSSRSFHDCSPYATCSNTEDSYTCTCNEGYDDQDSSNPGRYCTESVITTTVAESTTPSNSIYCNGDWCLLDLKEVCIDGSYCGCSSGQKRASDSDVCEEVDATVLGLRVIRRNNTILYYSSEYANPQNARYVEIVDIFNRGIGKAIGYTRLGKYYVTADTNYITQPRIYNSTWDSGLMFNFTVYTKKDKCDPQDLWNNLLGSIERTNYSIGNTGLYTSPYQINPWDTGSEGQKCADNLVCDDSLGEVCIAKKVCGCPSGYGRSSDTDECEPVEGFRMPLWVIKYNSADLEYNASFASPLTELYRTYVNRFKGGVETAYGPTTIWDHFVYTEVNDIQDPSKTNSTWDYGILYNFTVYFRKGQIINPEDTWTQLLKQIRNNGNEIGNSGLIIDEFQMNPWSSCYNNDCDDVAWCKSIGVRTYTCTCPPDYLDLNPSNPGHNCRSIYGYNECASDEDNECDKANGRCIDENKLYRCECNAGYIDASPEGSIYGSTCTLDYCSDLEATCLSNNATCVNQENRGVCICKDGYMDIRESPVLASYGLESAICIKITDVNECDLMLTNCSTRPAAICTDLRIGYTCACPGGFIDSNLGGPGRICAGERCGRCNGNGDCFYDEESGNTTCNCYEGWTGPYCAQAYLIGGGSILQTALPIILAILFFLLMLGCLLFLCRYCRCTKAQKGALIAGGGMSQYDESELYPQMTIPRPKLTRPEYDQYSVSGSSMSESDYGSEVERRVVTEVKKSTITRTVGGAQADAAMASAAAAIQGGSSQTTEAVVYRNGDGSSAAVGAGTPGISQKKMFGMGSEGGMARQSGTSYTQDRGMSEYVESEFDDISDEESRSTQSSEAGDSLFDKHTTVNKSQAWQPDLDGRGGTQKYRTEVKTVSSSNSIAK